MLVNKLNKKIVIERGDASTNEVGTPTFEWVTYAETWADVYTPYRNVQSTDGQQLVYQTEFTIRYNSKTSLINNKYRINYNNTYYKINQIVEIGYREGIKFITSAYEDE